MDQNARAPQIETLPDAAALARRAFEIIAEIGRGAVATRGRFTVALSGGSTPAAVYRLLAESGAANGAGLATAQTFFFLGDERLVPYEHPESNFRMVRETLMATGVFPDGNVFPVPTQDDQHPEHRTPHQIAELYSASLASFFGLPINGPAPPVFDLVLLGLGDDGHTASLFPGKPALDERREWVTWSTPGVLPPPVDRVTFTFPVLNAARRALFLVGGEKKAETVRRILRDNPDPRDAPAAGVRPSAGAVTWLLDEAAASKL